MTRILAKPLRGETALPRRVIWVGWENKIASAWGVRRAVGAWCPRNGSAGPREGGCHRIFRSGTDASGSHTLPHAERLHPSFG